MVREGGRTREAVDEDGEGKAVSEGIHDDALGVTVDSGSLGEEDVEEGSEELGGAALLHPLLLQRLKE